MKLKAWKYGSLAALVASGLASMASAQDQITLKFAHLFPETQYIWAQGRKVFAEAVTELSGSKVEFQNFPVGQFGKDMYGLASSGPADVVILIPSYDPAKFPKSGGMDLPGMYGSSCEGAHKVWALTQDGGILAEQEYGPNKLHVLFVGTNPPNQLMTANKQITSIADISGLKFRSLGSAAMDKALRALGGVPVKMNSGDVYDSVSRGTIDGAAFPHICMPDYELEKVLHFSVEGVALGSGSFIYVMRDDKWQALPEDVQKVMVEAGQKAMENLCTWQDSHNAEVHDRYIAEEGFKAEPPPEAEAAEWTKRMTEVGDTWATEMDAAGHNGTALLEAFRNAAGQ